jgi:hypothetical protein
VSVGGTASDLPRLLACSGSAALPQARSSSRWSEEGDDRHAKREMAALEGRYDELPGVVQKYLAAPDVLHVLPEIAVAYDWVSGRGRVLGNGIKRMYGQLAATEIAGTIDLLVVGTGWVLVIDYKGHRPGDVEAQLLLGAAAAASIYGGEVGTLVVPESGKPTHTMVDWAELEVFRQRLVRLHQDVAQARAVVAEGRIPSTNEGDHCRYCPAADHCPAKHALLKRMVSGDELTTVEMMAPLDVATAPTAYRMLRSMEAMTQRVRKHVYAYAAEHPIALGDGLVFGVPPAKQGSKVYDADKVYEAARTLYGQEFADAAVARESSEAAIKRAATKAGLPVAPTVRAVLAAVDEAGGVSRREPSKTPTEHTTRETEAA